MIKHNILNNTHRFDAATGFDTAVPTIPMRHALDTPVWRRVFWMLAVLLMVCAANTAAALSNTLTDSLKPQLKNQVVVKDTVVRLNDVFDNLGPIGYIEVATAPAPGQRIIRGAEWLGDIARQHGLTWRPQSKRDAIVIERAGQLVDDRLIKAAIIEALAKRRPDSHFEITLERGVSSLMAPIDVFADSADLLLVDDLQVQDTSGRFHATIAIVGTDTQSVVKGRLYVVERVPVLLRQVKPGDPIRAADLGWEHRRQRDIGSDVLRYTDDIIGMTPRRRNRPGQMLTQSDLEQPTLVKKGADVTIVLRADHMTLTARGRAKQSGVLGDTIQVENSQSRRPIFAVVEGPRLVAVSHLSANTLSSLASAQ